MNSLLLSTLNLIIIIISRLIAIAFYTLIERKFLGYIQSRKGPNKPRVVGTIVPLRDAGKLLLKQEKPSITSNLNLYTLGPAGIIILSLLLWPIFPHIHQTMFIKFSIAYFICITRISIYATFIAGWASNSRWGALGALRGIAQTISYEVRLSLIIICFILHQLKIDILSIFRDQYISTIVLTAPLMLIWLASIMAETHRAPLDFIEGESELVSGFNIEYRRSLFALIFISEYINILLIRLITIRITIKRLSNTELILKATILSFIFIWRRGSLPRLRYDSLINILWKKFLPFSLLWLVIIMTLVNIYWYWTNHK